MQSYRSEAVFIVVVVLPADLDIDWRRKLALHVLADRDGNAADESDDDDSPPKLICEDEGHIKVGWEEVEGGEVRNDRENLCDDHDDVPLLDLKTHHQELREDEGGEGDGDNVKKVIVKHGNSEHHDDPALIYAFEDPGKKGAKAQPAALLKLLVELWIHEGCLCIDVFIEDQ